MMQIAFVTIFFIAVESKINKGGNTKDDLELWRPDFIFNEKGTIDQSQKKIKIKSEAIFRQNEIKKSQYTSQWPKVLRQYTLKSTTRFTKMNMMREGGSTITSENPLEQSDDSWEKFSSYRIKQQLEKMAEKIPHSNVTVEVIGRTLEYQDIVLLKITKGIDETGKYFRADDDKYADETPEKKIIFIVHGLSVMGVQDIQCLSREYQFFNLATYYANHLDNFDIFLIPMANPDGYALLNTYKTFWNKNAAPQSECQGVALDRNFDVAWAINRSVSSCSQEYPGRAPFSEPETKAIRNIFHKYSHKIIAYLNVHAGTYDSKTHKGDAVLYPKGYVDSVSDDDKYIDLKGEIDEAIRNASFQIYSVTVDTLYNWYGRVTGTSVDYASTVYGIPFAMELVMQSYNNEYLDESAETYSDNAFDEVWSRVIDVIFKYIWKTLNKGNE